MSNTPLSDFLDKYAASDAARFHMPGHKGSGGIEKYDITEIDGAGNLFSNEGVIAESEEAASKLFGCRTYYSAEGSSLAIRTMLALAQKYRPGKVLAGRNAHRAFLSAAILLDLDVEWIYPDKGETYLSCTLNGERVRKAIDSMDETPSCVYVTSPDYLGNISDIESVAAVCREKDILLLVDNAHGAYLKFLSPSLHPIDLGADMCADSAHKTLPVLTGGAYLHLSEYAERLFAHDVKGTMEIFASSSPSYLIMRSLDRANEALETFPEKLSAFSAKVAALKSKLEKAGFELVGSEALKITVYASHYGYKGGEVSDILYKKGVICEFHDPDFISFMLTPENTEDDLERLCTALTAIEKRPALFPIPGLTEYTRPIRAMSPREAFFAPNETIPLKEAVGRILSSASVSCPPAVPIIVCGEKIDPAAGILLFYYGCKSVKVVK